MKRSPGSSTLADLLSWLEIAVGILLILTTVFLFFGTATHVTMGTDAGPVEAQHPQTVHYSSAVWLQLAIIGLVNLAGVGFLYDGIRRRGRRPT